MLKRTLDDLWRAFEIQHRAIEISAEAFDRGHKGEAVRLANSIFVLFGRGLRCHRSVLDQLGLQDRLRFPTMVPGPSESGSPLIVASLLKVGKDRWIVELLPAGRSALLTGRSLTFQEWWDEVVLKDGKGHTLTRSLLIRAMRDQDGGAHFDEHLTDPSYAAAVSGEFSGFRSAPQDGQPSSAVPFSLETTMRQVAEEVLGALRPFKFGRDVFDGE